MLAGEEVEPAASKAEPDDQVSRRLAVALDDGQRQEGHESILPCPGVRIRVSDAQPTLANGRTFSESAATASSTVAASWLLRRRGATGVRVFLSRYIRPSAVASSAS